MTRRSPGAFGPWVPRQRLFEAPWRRRPAPRACVLIVRSFIVLTLALLFLVSMILLTASDFASNGVTGLGVVGAVVCAIVGIGILGAFLQPPRS